MTYTKIDNEWLTRFLATLPAGPAVELLLQSRGNFRTKGLSLGQIITALPGRDPRTLQRALEALSTRGAISLMDGLYYSAGEVAGRCAGKLIPNSSNQEAENTVPDATADTGIKKKKEEERKQAGISAGKPDRLPARPLEKTEAVQKTSARDPLPALPVSPAVAFFTEVCGSFFVRVASAHLTRWHGQYSPEFITLAWTLSALQEKPTFAFQDWLDRSPGKTWPAPLKARYEADMAALYPPDVTSTVLREHAVKPGDMVRLPDGSTAKVERLDSSVFVTDHELDQYGYISYGAIGQGVEVLHS